MARPFGTVALGGTFDRLHVGHEALLGAAFAAGRSVVIGLTSAAYLEAHPKTAREGLQPYRVRARVLRSFLRSTYPHRRWTVVPLENRFGRAVRPGIDALAVSSETRAGGSAINDERRRRGLPPLVLIEVPLVLADDLRPVSSTRIRSGAITSQGHRRSRVQVELVGPGGDDLAAATRGVRRAFPRAAVRSIARSVRPAVRARPVSARWAAQASRHAELGIGLVPDGRGGWYVAVSSRQVALAPRHVAASAPGGLARGVLTAFRPADEKPI